MDHIKHRSLPATCFSLIVIITLNRLFGMLRTFLLAGIFGVSHEAAAFELAQTLTASLYDCTAGALIATMFLPSYIARRNGISREKADSFATTLSIALAIGVFLLFAPFILFPEQTVSLVANSLSREAQLSAAASLPPLSLARVLLAASSLFAGILQADKKPLMPALVYASASALSIPIVYLVKETLTAAKLSYLLLLIDCGVLLFLFCLVRKQHRPQALSSILPGQPIQTARRAVGVLLFSAYLPLSVCLSSLFFAAIGKDSAVAAGGYAFRPILLAAALLASAFHGVYYPRLSEERSHVIQSLKKPLALFASLSLLASAFFFLLAKPILFLFLQNAAVSDDFLLTAARIMRLYAMALPFLTIASLCNDAAYLLGQSGKVALISACTVLLNLLLFCLLKGSVGIYAVPLAFLISAAFRALFTQHLLQRIPQANRKIKLLLVLSDCNVGGAGRQLLNYLAHCDQNRFDVTVALPKGSILSERITALGFPTLSCGKEASFSPASLFSYYRLIKKHRPHILHANASLSARIAAYLAGVPIRLYTRHCVYPTPPLYRKRLARLAMRCATGLLSTSVIAVAEEAANNLYSMGVSKKKVNVIVNGVDPIAKNTDQRKSLRRQYSISPGETLAVICGRIEPDKGIRVLIE
ncbi:MAG: glycosyltransferase, partial [Clostridia bacterium]|nr:glycosyltransferase [Clostridia bacterium]